MTLEQLQGRTASHAAVLVDSCPYCGHNLVSCRVPDCDRASRARGLCKAHYGRFLRLGNVAADVPLKRRAINDVDTSDIRRLFAVGLSRRAIARELGINRETVREIVKDGAS